ncbi:MAG: S-layer homology domain-containing protein, partial [Clostridia bacterium]|nr:S-layer homology domain-containing protein [Clostridia bacterium]
QTVYDFLIEELELCPAAAAGIMGNVMIECGFDPDLEVIDTNNKPSYGLMMWNGSRYESLKEWCAENGYKKSDPEGQLGWLKWELNNTEKASYKAMKEIPNTIEGAARAAILWASEFERCTRTSYGLRVYYALNNYWQKYAGGTVSNTPGIYGYYYNVPDNIKYGEPLTLYGAVVSYSSELKSITAGVYTESGELVTGKTISASNLAGNIGVIDRYVVLNKVPRGSYYYTITAVNASGEYIVERHSFTVSDEPTTATLVPESEGGVICANGAACPQLSYKDMLPATHWAHDSVDFVLKNGYFLGNGNGYFLPTTDMSRAMAVTVLHRIAESVEASAADVEVADSEDVSSVESGSEVTPASDTDHEIDIHADEDCTCTCTCSTCSTASGSDKDSTSSSTGSTGTEDEPKEAPFIDVEAGSWYEEHVTWAHENGIVQGKSEGIFDPNGTVSRSELATLMYRLAEHLGLSTEYTDTTASFADGATLADWERDGLVFAVSAGLIGGIPHGDELYLDGASFATREQVSAILYRFVKLGK